MRLLYLTHRLPYGPDRGDRIRAYHTLRVLAGNADVHVFSLVHDAAERRRVPMMRGLASGVTTAEVPRLRNLAAGVALLPSSRPLTHLLLHAPAARGALERLVRTWRPDAVLAFCSGMAPLAMMAPLHDIPFVLDMVDVDSGKWEDYSRTSRGLLRWVYAREARCLGRFEEAAIRHAHATLVVNERERRYLASRVPDADIRVLGNGIDIEAFRPEGPPASIPRVVFTGVFSYRPNERGALWFARDVWPRIRAARPDARLTLVGANPTQAIRDLTVTDSSIEVTGTVPEVRPYLWSAAVGVAPLLEARGVQNKVLEAIAAGLPVVTTPVVAQGLPHEALAACRIGADPQDYAGAVLDLLALSPEGRRTIAGRADLSSLTWRDRMGGLLPLLYSAAANQKSSAEPLFMTA